MMRKKGIVKLLRLRSSQGRPVGYPGPLCLLSRPLHAGDLGPTLESCPHLLAILRCGPQMPSRSKMLGHRSIRRQKSLQLDNALNHVVEQDHRAVKRVTRPMLGFKSFDTAQGTLAGVELMHMIKKGQLGGKEGEERLTPAEPFSFLAASSRTGRLSLPQLPYKRTFATEPIDLFVSGHRDFLQQNPHAWA
jgi:DDE superfamily endonuclease